jgi:hypothetical protein
MKKYFELISIPAAFLMLLLYNHIAGRLGLHTFAFDMFGKVFVAFLMFLVATGFVRLVYILMFPTLYKYFDSSFNEHKEGWKNLEFKERVLYAVLLYGGMLLVFALILNGL